MRRLLSIVIGFTLACDGTSQVRSAEPDGPTARFAVGTPLVNFQRALKNSGGEDVTLFSYAPLSDHVFDLGKLPFTVLTNEDDAGNVSNIQVRNSNVLRRQKFSKELPMLSIDATDGVVKMALAGDRKLHPVGHLLMDAEAARAEIRKIPSGGHVVRESKDAIAIDNIGHFDVVITLKNRSKKSIIETIQAASRVGDKGGAPLEVLDLQEIDTDLKYLLPAKDRKSDACE